MKVKVYGTLVSPWVSRLVAVLEEKSIDYEVETVIPLGEPDPDFLKISPMGKIPVLEIDGKFMPDSLAAAVLLEDEVPTPAMFPDGAWDKAWVIWLNDFLGAGLFSKIEAPLFVQRFINHKLQQQDPDQAKIDEALALLPSHFDYLESQLDDGRLFLVGETMTLVDLTAATIFINLRHAGEEVDADRWPHLAAFVRRMHARPSIKVIIDAHREMFGAMSPLFAKD